MKIRLIVVIILAMSLSSCFKSPTEIGGPVVIVEPTTPPVIIKPGKATAEGKHIINNTLVNLDITRFASDSARIDTSGSVPYIWLKGDCMMSLVNIKPPQPNLLNVALQSISFRLDSLPLSEVDCRLRNSPMKGTGISFQIRRSIIRRDGGGKEFRDTTTQQFTADGSKNLLATARLIDTYSTSAQFPHQYMIEITFHLMIGVDKAKGMDDDDEWPIVGKINVPISY